MSESENREVFGTTMTKVDFYGWESIDNPGQFMMLPKSQLYVDSEYQREKIHNGRVLLIAREWSWRACGCLLVVRRDDGTYWTFDGQHRKLAADKRADITNLPCLVFQCTSKGDEAEGFLAANKCRGPMATYDAFRAELVSGNQTACAISSMLDDIGYALARSSASGRQLACIKALWDMCESDPQRAERILRLCAEICDGTPIQTNLLKGLYCLDKHLAEGKFGSLFDPKIRQKLAEAGPEVISKWIRSSVAYHGSGGGKPWAQGILNLLNHKRRDKNKIPDIAARHASGTPSLNDEE